MIPGMADADAHPPVIRPDQRVDRAQTVMAGSAAAALDPQLARPQIDLVVDHDDLLGRDLIEPRRLGDRFAGIVHEGLRLQQKPPLAADRPFGELASEAAAKAREAVPPGDRVDRHEADIVPVAGVAGAGIAEADDKAHRR